MKRKAILIESSDVKGLTDLPGARVDIDNWSLFLRSDLGGAWKDSEIVILRKPFSSDVKKELSISSDCYCFVAFSGHGCEGSVALNDYRGDFPTADLKPTGERGTLIVDSCRGEGEGRKYMFANQSRDVIALNAKYGDTMALYESKSAAVKAAQAVNRCFLNWITALKNSSPGVVEMLSCAKGEAAGEDPTSGGYYTSLLMQSAEQWNQRSTIAKVHTTKEAHDYAASRLPPQQKAEYSPRSVDFPFAAKA